MGDNPVKEEVKDFNKDKLKKTETSVKSYKPTKEGRCSFKGKQVCCLQMTDLIRLGSRLHFFLSSLFYVVQLLPACHYDRQLQTLHLWLTAGTHPTTRESSSLFYLSLDEDTHPIPTPSVYHKICVFLKERERDSSVCCSIYTNSWDICCCVIDLTVHWLYEQSLLEPLCFYLEMMLFSKVTNAY